MSAFSMKLAKFSIVVSALVFCGIGLACLFFPVQTASIVDIELNNVTATVDFRANYGGFAFGLGIIFIIAIFKSEFVRPALFVQALSFAGFALGRVVGILLDGMPKMIIVYFLVLEIIGVIVAVYCLKNVAETRA